MSELLKVSSNPHVRARMKTDNIMLLVLIALLPSAFFGVVNFGLRSLAVLAVSVVSAVLTEYLYEKLMHKKITIGDFSAAVTGLLLGLNLPSTVPLWLPVIGNVFAILFVKQLFGGLGQNFMNPALAGRCFLLISFAGRMTDFTWDGVSSATPLAALKAGESVQVLDMFLGKTAGTIGETSVIAILIGAIVLLWFEVIDLRIPGSYILSFAVCTLLFGGHGLDFGFLLAELCGGGLMLGAFFMATDYVTSPVTRWGQVIFGIGCGALTVLIRYFGSYPEGVSYAILIMNACVGLLDKVGLPRRFGVEKKGGAA